MTLADVLLEDLSRALPGEYKTITALAPAEVAKYGKNLDILPISAYNEAFDAYHRTCVGTDGDWESNMKQFLRCGRCFHIHWRSGQRTSLQMHCSDKAVAAHPKLTSVP